ncbi:hypothetical protein GGI43DRAFT_19748 [Trichoderma evansii]
MDLVLVNLPYHIFCDIILYLSPIRIISCRRTSRLIHEALMRDELCVTLISRHFPRSREGRRLRQLLRAEDNESLDRGNWAAVFAQLARRYYYLGRAKPCQIIKVPVLKSPTLFQGVAPWNRVLSLNNRNTVFHYQDPVWTVAPTEGLLVYPAPKTGSSGPEYRARDLANGVEVKVPFEMKDKIVRRLRISHGILVIEWCPIVPMSTESFHRHYVTVYDVRRTGSWDGVIPQRPAAGAVTPTYTWEVEFRCEFEIHDLGLQVNKADRFFSTHNATHYAIYLWQVTPFPSPTLSNTREPIERLIIWEFGNPSKYRPSEDISGEAQPDEMLGPRVIRKMTNPDLDAWSVLQRLTPSLRTLALDDCTWDDSRDTACGHIFFTEEDHKWSAGRHSTRNPPRFHLVKTTGIPLVGDGPRWVDECRGGSDANIQPSRRSRWRRHATETYKEEEDDGYDDNGENAEDAANIDSSGSGIITTNTTSTSSLLKTIPWARHSETWPGRAPCWRHVDFPYMTMSEVLDIPAGIRIIARQCFMLATLSTFSRPKINIQGVNEDGPIPRKKKGKRKARGLSSGDGGSRPSSSGSNSSSRLQDGQSAAGKQSQGGKEVQKEIEFSVTVWPQIMSKGCIYGDERWLIGEDVSGDVTILMF